MSSGLNELTFQIEAPGTYTVSVLGKDIRLNAQGGEVIRFSIREHKFKPLDFSEKASRGNEMPVVRKYLLRRAKEHCEAYQSDDWGPVYSILLGAVHSAVFTAKEIPLKQVLRYIDRELSDLGNPEQLAFRRMCFDWPRQISHPDPRRPVLPPLANTRSWNSARAI